MSNPITEDKKAMARTMIEAGGSYRQAAEVLGISSWFCHCPLSDTV